MGDPQGRRPPANEDDAGAPEDEPDARYLAEQSVFTGSTGTPAEPAAPTPQPPAAPVPARRVKAGGTAPPAVPAKPVPPNAVPAQPVPAKPVAPKVVSPGPTPVKPKRVKAVPAQPVPAQPVPAQAVPPRPVAPRLMDTPAAGTPMEPPRRFVDKPPADWGPGSAAQSVLTRIEERAGDLPRILLQEVPSEPSPLVMANTSSIPSGRALDHYDLLGEIGRGAVGVILKGRDVDLGRDVAIKLLREEYASRQDVAQRFVEEAQISGQLQHPGIAPLYELGAHPDGRPYFAMKLIKGRTLAGLLNDRHDVTKGRHHFLGIFEHVCQAMAYAHSRGVIHRDLKPSNIMVGAFGEVQVMDWGFAKVLSRGGVADERSAKRLHSVVSVIETVRSTGDDVGSQSLAGSLMGTPPYMSPEQASGEIDLVDARSDVFSLGAVLCEILTGMPPYVAQTPDGGIYEVVKLASQARLGPAKERLASCGASEELISICLSCLTPARAARPGDAGVLTKEISAYLAAVDERARKAQLAAVAERGRAATAQARADAAAKAVEQERKARRLTLGLASAVLAAVLIGGGGYLLLLNQRKAQQAETARSTSAALEEAARLEGLAIADELGDLTHWTAAVTAARQAQEIASSAGGDEELVGRASAVVQSIEEKLGKARERAEQAERDASMIEQLEHLRAQKGDDFRPHTAEEQYTAAFQEYGLDIDKEDVGEVAARIAASTIAPQLVAALDEWSWVRAYGTVAKALLSRPLDVARLADKDAWRARLRRAIEHRDGPALERLARTEDVSALSASSVHLLASALANDKKYESAVSFLRRARVHHPQDLWINFYLGHWLTKLSPPRWQEAARAYAAATTIRPQGAAGWNNLGIALQSLGELDDAVMAYEMAIRLRPEYASAHNNLGTLWLERGDHDQALASFRRAVKVQVDHGPAHYGIGAALQAQGHPKEAMEAYKAALAYRPDLSQAHYALAGLLESAGRADEMLEAAGRAVAESPNEGWAHRNYAHLLWMRGEREKALAEYQKAVDLDENDPVAHHDYGVAKGWMRDWKGAITLIERACELAPTESDYRASLGWVLSSMGDTGGAIREFSHAIQLDPQNFSAHDQLGTELLKSGDLRGARDSFVKAIEVDPDHANKIAYLNLGRLVGQQMGQHEAEAFFKERVPTGTRAGRIAFLKGLFVALYQTMGDAEGALEANRTARMLDAKDSLLWVYEAIVLRALGRLESALDAAEKAVELAPESPSAHAQLGSALMAMGRFEDAVRSFEACDEFAVAQAWSQPTKDWLAQSKRLVEIHNDLPAILARQETPTERQAALDLVAVLRATENWGSAATVLKDLLLDPETDAATVTLLRYEAACMAARAGTETGNPQDPRRPDPEDRAAWRRQALEWLQHDLDLRRAAMRTAPNKAPLRRVLRHWTQDPDLAGLRDASRVQALSSDEREKLLTFWTNLDAVLLE